MERATGNFKTIGESGGGSRHNTKLPFLNLLRLYTEARRNRSSTRGSVDTPLACSLPNRNAVPASSPGLPLRLPWVKSFMDPQPQGGCAVLDSLRKWRNRFAVDYFFIRDPRVAKRQPWAAGRNRVAVKSLLSKTLHRG